MHNIILFIHVLVAFLVVVLVLIQQGKGADTGASFGGGGSQTVFGSQGSGNFLSHTTAILAAVFFATSFGLALMAKKEAETAAPTFTNSAQEIPAPTTSKDAPSVPLGAPVPMPAPVPNPDIPVKK